MSKLAKTDKRVRFNLAGSRLRTHFKPAMTGAVGVFWDLENVPVPRDKSGTDLAQALHATLKPFGKKIRICAFADAEKVKANVRVGLMLAGVSLIDTKNVGKKDTVDKMIIARMFEFALDNASPATIVLVSGDVDFAISLSILRSHDYKTILVVPSHVESRDELKKNADHLFRVDDILKRDEQFMSPIMPHPLTASGDNDDAHSEHSLSSAGIEDHIESFMDAVHDTRGPKGVPIPLSVVTKTLCERWLAIRPEMVNQLAQRATDSGWIKISKSAAVPDDVFIEIVETNEEKTDDCQLIPLASKRSVLENLATFLRTIKDETRFGLVRLRAIYAENTNQNLDEALGISAGQLRSLLSSPEYNELFRTEYRKAHGFRLLVK